MMIGAPNDFAKLGALVDLFHGAGGDVEVVALALAGLALCLLTASMTNSKRLASA